MSTSAPQTGIDSDELHGLLGEITAAAIETDAYCITIATEDPDEVQAAYFVMRERIAYMGWIADRIAGKAGLLQARGGADEWLLPPPLRPSETIRGAADGIRGDEA
ncbi:MAG: hypothetical protein M9951_16915 [Burkholderiaceae bacterium]|nr:hypothetical protein [Burkholderiaceae bacterium]